MNIIRVEGDERAEIFLYTLSTCAWCRKTKAWLKKRRLSFSYVDVDLERPEDRGAVMNELRRWNPRASFPTVVFNDRDCVVGYKPEKFKELLG
jgi:glutaredoxin-like protein NrdH